MMRSHESHKTRTLWLTGMLHGFTHVYNVALIPLYLLIQRDFKFDSVSKATSFVTVLMLAYFLPSYPMGVLADRLNRKKLLGWGLAINGIGFVALAFAPNYPCAIAAVLVAGFGGSFYHPAATAMIARLFPKTTGRALGLAGIGSSAGFFLGPIYTGWRAQMLEPISGAAAWRRPVFELGVLGILAAGMFALLADDEKPAPIHERKFIPSTKLFPTPALWFFFIACSLAFSLRDFAGGGFGSLASLFLQKAHGYDESLTGLAVGGIFLASAVGNPLFGRLSDGGRIRWTLPVLLVASALIAVFPHVRSGWTIPTLVAYGFFLLPSYPIVEAALMESVPDAVRGRVYGFFITVSGVVGNLSHWFVGARVKHMGDAAYSAGGYFAIYGAFALLIVLSLAGLPCLYAIRKREHLEAPSDPAKSPFIHPQSAL